MTGTEWILLFGYSSSRPSWDANHMPPKRQWRREVFDTESVSHAMQTVIFILKKSARRMKRSHFVFVFLVNKKEIYLLRKEWRDPVRLLTVEDPSVCFVKSTPIILSTSIGGHSGKRSTTRYHQ